MGTFMQIPRPSPYYNGRPAYLEKFFNEISPIPQPPTNHNTRSASSSISSLASSNSAQDHRALQSHPPPPPIPQEESVFDDSDKISIRSFKLHLKPRFKLRKLLSRRAHMEVKEMVEFTPRPQTSPTTPVSPRRPSLPKIQTAMALPVRGNEPSPTTELQCEPCYYFTARHCHGYVMAVNHGEACENCAAAGFFGAS